MLMGMEYGPTILAALLIMAAGFFVAGWVVRLVQRRLARIELEPPVRQLLLRIFVLGLLLLLALQNLEVELLPLIAGLGVRVDYFASAA